MKKIQFSHVLFYLPVSFHLDDCWLLVLTIDSVVDGINNAPGGLNEKDMSYDEHPLDNEIQNSAYNVATRASDKNELYMMLSLSAFALAVVVPVTQFALSLQFM